MSLLRSFTATRFRGIDGLSLPSLTAANLVTGANGVGKTALLEAMWLFMGRYSPMLLWNGNVQRSSNSVLDPIRKLSRDSLELHGNESGMDHGVRWTFERVTHVARPVTVGGAAGERMAQLPVVGRIDTYLDGELAKGTIGGMQPTHAGMVMHENPATPAVRPNCVIEGTRFQLETPNEYLQHYSDTVRKNGKQELTSAINLMLPKVHGVEILTGETGESYLSGVTADGTQLPLHDLGGGVIRLCRLLLSFSACSDGLLLADEIENGIHHSALPEVWNRARRWMREWRVQLVATTHSAECLEAAMAAFADAPDDLSIHRLFKNGVAGRVEVMTFTGETLEGARDISLEMR